MKTITAIKIQNRRPRVGIFLDGQYAFSLSLVVANKQHLRVGQIFSENELDEILRTDQLQKGMDSALRFLSYRPRSEAEVRARLQRSFADWTVSSILAKLKEQGLIDDLAFAQFWRENRDSFRPRSRRLLSLELRKKGVSPETAAQITEGLDDESSAYRAGKGKAHNLRGLDYQDFRRKLGSYLHRRGFDYSTAAMVVNRLWQEVRSSSQDNGLESEA